MGPFRFTQKSAPALLIGAGVITAIAASTTAALVMIGMPPAVMAAPQAPPDPHVATADWKVAPATTALSAALDNPPAGWTKQGDLRQLVTAPLPYSCPQPGLAPSVALARNYTAGGVRFQVITLAYTAGIGAEAARRQAANAYLCAGTETGLTLSGVTGPGSDAKQATTTRGGVRATVVSFRRGDVIAYVAGVPGDPLHELAKAFDGGLTGQLADVCVNQESTAADTSRTPWSLAGYKPFTEDAKVAIPEVPLPSTGPEAGAPSAPATASPATGPATPPSAASPSPAPTAALVRVPVPAPALVERTAKPMDRPLFPVAPAMPAAVPEPAPPRAPAAKAATELALQVPANDTQGPGCGWAFTGMKPLPFDDAAATVTRTGLLTAARTALESDAKTWQASVVTYWIEYEIYRKAAEAYNAYAAKVGDVNGAWSVIAAAWDTYNKAVQERDLKVAERDAFLKRQDQARTDFDTKQAACAAVPAPDPAPSPSASPTDSPTPTAAPSPTASPKPGCPAERPAILDRSAPEVPAEPARPADPVQR